MPRRPPLTTLPRRGDFLKAAASGSKSAQPGMVVQARAVPGQPFRIGFTVTRKVGNAVVRNRARRRLRAAADAVLRPDPPAGWDLVLVGRAATPERPFDLLCADLARALAASGVRR